MIRKILMSGFVAFVISLSLVTVPARAEARGTGESLATTESARFQSRRFGPYATLRRANEVANYARSLGYNAKVIYGGSLYYGTREYYVDVW